MATEANMTEETNVSNSESDANLTEETIASNSEPDATFLGWQKTRSGEVFALYNVTAANHPSRGSTVTENGLQKLNLHVPGVQLLKTP